MTLVLAAHRQIGYGLGRAAGGTTVAYSAKIINLFGSALVGYYPLSEIVGTTIFDASGNGRNGGLSGSYTLGADGIGDGGTSIEFNNTGQAAIYSGVRVGSPWDIFAEGSLLSWMRVVNSAVWSDGAMRSVANVYSDYSVSQGHKLGKSNDTNNIRYLLGPPNSMQYSVGNSVAWHHIAVAWSQSANEASLYWDGVRANTKAWTSLAATYTQVVVSSDFIGCLAHVAYLNRAATGAEILTASTL